MIRGPEPTHVLSEVQAACRRPGGIAYKGEVLATASAICHDPVDIVECLCGLGGREFRKTMPSEQWPGRFQDVYKTRSHGFAVYIKFDYDRTADRVILLSFKQDEDA